MSRPLIETRGLTLRLGGRTVLEDVDFAIRPGEIVTIVGPNGSGKTSFLKCLLGAVSPGSGQVIRKPGLRLGYVPQRLHLDPVFPMTVSRFLTLGLPRGADPAPLARRLGIAPLMPLQLAELSGGQAQRVLLAHALAAEPELLLLDEATQGLDQPATAAFYRLIEQIAHDSGCAVVMVSHDLHVVMRASDRVICLNRHICCQGTPTVVAEAPEYRRLFGLGTAGTFALYRHEHDHHHDLPHGGGDDG